ncbi:MAG: glycine cleavage system protein T [Candidatus Marinimicrobia bacterium]|nr:glycine cleavage system protein T [Candidatus Neomarinimicrobiota bacterium]
MKTSLYNRHIKLNAKIVDFAGYQMPINYPKGISKECYSVRKNLGIFDVSHMGQILVEGKNSFEFVQRLTTNDVSKIKDGQCQYTLFCNEDGGIIDDLILYKIKENRFMLVVNAANIDKDYKWIFGCNNGDVKISNLSSDISLIALQGPNSRKILSNFAEFENFIDDLKFYHFEDISEKKDIKIISRTGYTGELGYEIYGSHSYIKSLWDKLINDCSVSPIGLAARDILRLEMCYRLYGNDMDEKVTPFECDLGWVVDKEGDFLGRNNVMSKIKSDKKLISISMNERCIPRKGYKIYNLNDEIGYITSGTFSPTINKGIAMGYVDLEKFDSNNIFVKIRNKNLSADCVKGAFIKGNSLFE